MRPDFQRDSAARHLAEDLAQRFRIGADALLQLYLAGFVQHAVPAVAISQIESDGQLRLRKIFVVFTAAVLTSFIAGLLYLLCLEHVDNLGAYSIPPETGLLIPSVFDGSGAV